MVSMKPVLCLLVITQAAVVFAGFALQWKNGKATWGGLDPSKLKGAPKPDSRALRRAQQDMARDRKWASVKRAAGRRYRNSKEEAISYLTMKDSEKEVLENQKAVRAGKVHYRLGLNKFATESPRDFTVGNLAGLRRRNKRRRASRQKSSSKNRKSSKSRSSSKNRKSSTSKSKSSSRSRKSTTLKKRPSSLKKNKSTKSKNKSPSRNRKSTSSKSKSSSKRRKLSTSKKRPSSPKSRKSSKSKTKSTSKNRKPSTSYRKSSSKRPSNNKKTSSRSRRYGKRELDESLYNNRTRRSVTSFDWRDQGKVTPVKVQGEGCGSCWAFTAAALIETATAIKTNSAPRSLSVQQIIDCAEFAHGCDGGLPADGLEFALENGVVTTQQYAKYSRKKNQCTPKQGGVMIEDYDERSEDEPMQEAEMRRLVMKGPVAVGVHLHPKLRLYKSGVFNEPGCPDKCGDKFCYLNHAMLVVGFGESSDGKYWIVKNSFGTKWGEKGYMRIKRGVNMCGVEIWPTWVI